MNGILNHTLKHKNLLCSYTRFISSAAQLETPAVRFSENTRTEPDGVRILRSPTNSRPLTPTQIEAAHACSQKSGLLVFSDGYGANDMLKLCSEYGQTDWAFEVFDKMPVRCIHKQGLGIDAFTYSSVLSSCVPLQLDKCGHQIHCLAMKNGLYLDYSVTYGLVDLYAKSCRLDDALRVLNDVDCENVVSWNVVISAAVKSKDYSIVLGIFIKLCRESSLIPNAFTFSRVLTSCVATGEVRYGRSIHALVIKAGFGSCVLAGNSVVDFYARSGDVNNAIKQFESMPVQNANSWAAIVNGFVHSGDSHSAVRVLNNVRKIGEDVDKFTISTVLSTCAKSAMFLEVIQIHCWTSKTGIYSDNVLKSSLINTYAKLGAIGLSELVFADGRDMKEVTIWGNMISAYVHSRNHEKATILFCRMLAEGMTPDKFIASGILGTVENLMFGQQLHGYTVKTGMAAEVTLGSAIFIMYSKCGYFLPSVKAFKDLKMKDIVSWTSMISGFVELGLPNKAIQLFRQTRVEDLGLDDKLLAVVITACSDLNLLNLSKEVHGYTLQCGFGKVRIVEEALVNMYSKCGDLGSATLIFDKMQIKDPVSWSSIISGFARIGQADEALNLLNQMLLSGLSLNSFAISSVVGVFAMSGKPQIGAHLHSNIIKVGLESSPSVGSSLVMMYSKSGSIDNCVEAFRQITNPDLVSWTAVIESYGYHGKGQEALSLFELMKESGIRPDAFTLLGVLSACSHAGLVDEGYFHFNSMTRDYGIEPGYKHYCCMVDLLGRAGKLEEAHRFISNMPMEPGRLVWETLLTACKVHRNWEIGKLAARKIMELQPVDPASYVSVSNIWAEVGQWERVEEMRGMMKKSGIKKTEPGWSYV